MTIGCLTDVVYALTPAGNNETVDPTSLGGIYLEGVIASHPDCAMLSESMLRAFVEVERMGGSNQFYDKFQARQKITQIIQYLWSMQCPAGVGSGSGSQHADANGMQFSAHRTALVSAANSDSLYKAGEVGTLFACFANVLLNDAIWLLDEGIEGLQVL